MVASSLEMKQAGGAQSRGGDPFADQAQIDSEVGTEKTHLERALLGACKINRFSGIVEEKGRLGVRIVGQQIRQNVLERHLEQEC